MKKYIINTQIRLISVFSLLFLLLFVQAGVAQRISKIIEKEIPVSEQVTVKTYGPISPRITGRGVINTRQIEDRYVVSGKNVSPYIYVVHKSLEVFSWDKPSIKQIVAIELECNNQSDAENLLNHLDLNLRENVTNTVLVNCELNIERFNVNNGWFKEDNNSITLKDGVSYPIKYLELKNSIYIPKNCLLDLETNRVDVTIQNHAGDIQLNMDKGSFSAKTLQQVYGKCESVHLNIPIFKELDLSIKNSHLKLGNGSSLILESSISTIEVEDTDQLIITKSLNDEISIQDVQNLSVEESLFSNYKIMHARNSVEMKLKNSDVNIENLHHNFREAIISNQHGNININTKSLEGYKLRLQHPEQSNFTETILGNMIKKKEFFTVYQYGLTSQNSLFEIACNQCKVAIKPF